MRLGNRAIGIGAPCFIIAEAGVNHNGDVELARRLIDVAAEAGADAVKFQTFRAETVSSGDAPKAAYQMATTDAAESQREMLRRLELDRGAHQALAGYAHGKGILFFSTPFDSGSADLLNQLGVSFFKVSSGDLTCVPLLRHLAGMGKPIILSTGMAELDEIGAALDTLTSAGARDVVLLQCVSQYPAPPADANLRAMAGMRERFGKLVGYSDHTLGVEVAVAAAVLGAVIIEKHVTLDRSLPGPDHTASLEPQEFRELVRQVRSVESAIGDGVKRVMPSELANRTAVRRSLVAAIDIPAGSVLIEQMVDCRRPGDGISASQYDAVIGRRARRGFRASEKLAWEGLE